MAVVNIQVTFLLHFLNVIYLPETKDQNVSIKMLIQNNSYKLKQMVGAQLVERLSPTPEIRGSNPVIGKLLSNIC